MANEIVPVSVGDYPSTSATSAESRPSGFAGAFFDRMQKAAEAAKAPAAEVAKPEDVSTEVVVAPEVPVAVEKTDAATTEVLADAGKTAAAAHAKEGKTSDSIRAMVKASNLPTEAKDEIASLAYQGRAAQENGMTPDVIRAFKDQGVTPASVLERIKLHPTFDDAKRDAWYGNEMRRVAADYSQNPDNFLLRLKDSIPGDPAIFNRLVRTAAKYLPELAPDVVKGFKIDGIRTALSNLGSEALASDDEELQLSVRNVQVKFGFNPSAPVATAPAVNAEVEALKKQNAEFVQRQKAAEEASRTQFLTSVVTEGRNRVYAEIGRRWNEAAPAGLDANETKRAIDDIFKGVESDLSGVQNFIYDLESKRNGPLTEQAWHDTVKYAFDRATPFIPYHQKAALDFWSKRAIASTTIKEETEKRAAGNVDAAKVGGIAPIPSAAPDTKQRLKEAKAAGLNFQDMMLSAWRK